MHKHYHWIPESKRIAVREFFTKQYGISACDYSSNEAFFIKLIYNTVKEKQLRADFKVAASGKLCQTLDKVMKSMPNNTNLHFFFSSAIVHQLWHGGASCKAETFSSSGFAEIQRKLSAEDRAWFISKLESISTDIV